MDNNEIIFKIIESSEQKEILTLILELISINGVNNLIVDNPLITVSSIHNIALDEEMDDPDFRYTYADRKLLNYKIGDNNHYLLSGGYEAVDESKYIALERLVDMDAYINDYDLKKSKQVLYYEEDVWLNSDDIFKLYEILFYELYILMKNSNKYYIKNEKYWNNEVLSFEAGVIGEINEEKIKWLNLFNIVSQELRKYNEEN